MTDLSWITDCCSPISAMVVGVNSADDGVTEVSDAIIWSTAPGAYYAVRLSLVVTTDDELRLLVNGEDEEREDFYALLGALENLQAWRGKVQELA